MMDSGNVKKNIALSILLSLLCLTIAAAGTYAWLSNHFHLSAEKVTMQLEYGGISIKDFHIYKYIQSTGTVVDLTREEDPGRVITEENGHELTPFDSLLKERNINTPLVFEMTLICEDLEDLYLDCACSSKYPKEDEQERRHTSNIMRIGAATATCVGITAEDTTDEAKFNKVVAYFDEQAAEKASTKTFLTATKNPEGSEEHYTFEKVMSISCPVSKGSGEKLPEDKVVTIYYIMDYAKNLVDAQEVNEYEKLGIMQQYVPFYDDIEFTGFTIKTDSEETEETEETTQAGNS